MRERNLFQQMLMEHVKETTGVQPRRSRFVLVVLLLSVLGAITAFILGSCP